MEDKRERCAAGERTKSATEHKSNIEDRPGGKRKITRRQMAELQRRRERKRRLQRQYRVISWVLTGVFVIVFYAFICLIIGDRKLYDKTCINGINVGNMKTEEASKLIDADYNKKYSKASVRVELNGEYYTLDVSAALGKKSFDSVKAIQDRTHSFWRRGYGFLESKIGGTSYDLYPEIKNISALKSAIESSELMKVDLSKEDGYVVDKDKLILVKGKGSYVVDEDKLSSNIKKNVEKGDYDTVIKCPEMQADVDIDALYDKLHCEPQNPTLDPENGYKLVKAKDGVDFDLNAAKKALASAKNGDKVEIPLVLSSADMTTKEYEELLFRDQISSYSTEVDGSDNRKTNVKMAAQYCDGTILMPGESFSYNLGVGELTEERGFLPGPSYANGESVLDMGGGICQVSSTMYMACLYANLEIDERHCHPYPASYVPAGLDATVAWGGCDFVFTNDTDYPIKITTTYDGYSTSCTIWGTITEPFSVELYTETLETEPYETKYELDKSLGKDEQVLDTVGIEGLTIQSYRRVYDGDGNVISDDPEAVSVYSVRDEVYKVGKLPSKKEKNSKKDDSKTSDTSENNGSAGASTEDNTGEQAALISQ